MTRKRASRKFNGFPPGKTRLFSVPAIVITDLLPLIDHLGELKLTLYAFWAVQQREGRYRYLLRRDFETESLLAALGGVEGLDDALQRACDRGTILVAEVALAHGVERLYFMNTETGRTALEQIAQGEWKPGDNQPVEILPERPNVYRLYEENIGPLTPLIADALKDAEQEYSSAWVADAIRVAVENNALHLRFIQGVLERWRKEGKRAIPEGSDERDGRRYISGKYAGYIEH